MHAHFKYTNGYILNVCHHVIVYYLIINSKSPITWRHILNVYLFVYLKWVSIVFFCINYHLCMNCWQDTWTPFLLLMLKLGNLWRSQYGLVGFSIYRLGFYFVKVTWSLLPPFFNVSFLGSVWFISFVVYHFF